VDFYGRGLFPRGAGTPKVLLCGLPGATPTFDLYASAGRAPDRYTAGSDLRCGIKAGLRRAGIRLAVPLHQITMSGSEAESQVVDERARLIGE
jgi:small-conductance mechanosensitive channel